MEVVAIGCEDGSSADSVAVMSLTSPRISGTISIEGERLIARSADDSVTVVWDSRSDRVIIDTRLPDELYGTVELSASRAARASEAWRAAQRVWEWLSMEGAVLPKLREAMTSRAGA